MSLLKGTEVFDKVWKVWLISVVKHIIILILLHLEPAILLQIALSLSILYRSRSLSLALSLSLSLSLSLALSLSLSYHIRYFTNVFKFFQNHQLSIIIFLGMINLSHCLTVRSYNINILNMYVSCSLFE